MDAVQTLGGVLLVWDKRVFEKIDFVVRQFSVNVLLRGVVDGFVWTCTGVYGPNRDRQQAALWEELACARWTMAWCLIGDFYIIRYSSEGLGCESFGPAMFAFSDFIENNYLVDLPLRGLRLPGLRNLRHLLCQELTRLWFHWTRRNILGMFLKECSFVLFLIVAHSCWKLVVCVGVIALLNLRKCG